LVIKEMDYNFIGPIFHFIGSDIWDLRLVC